MQFSVHVNAGKTAAEAARLAGYAESTAMHKATTLTSMARAAGLLPTEDEARSVKAQVFAELRAGVVDVVRELVKQAMDGDVPAAREVLARVLGPIPQKHAFATAEGITQLVHDLIDIMKREARTDAEQAFSDRLSVLWLARLESVEENG